MFNIQQSRWSIKSTSDTQRSVSKQGIVRYLTIKGGFIELDCIMQSAYQTSSTLIQYTLFCCKTVIPFLYLLMIESVDFEA